MAAEIPALKVSRDSVVVSSSGRTGRRIPYMSWSCSMEFCTCTGGLL